MKNKPYVIEYEFEHILKKMTIFVLFEFSCIFD